jgi:hypothetical protein
VWDVRAQLDPRHVLRGIAQDLVHDVLRDGSLIGGREVGIVDYALHLVSDRFDGDGAAVRARLECLELRTTTCA